MSMFKKDPYFFLILGTIAIWIAFGTPGDTMARLFFMQSSAPWERVDGYFYPEAGSNEVVERRDMATLIDCRRWAIRMASQNQDARMLSSDYRCGVGEGDMNGYRIVLQ